VVAPTHSITALYLAALACSVCTVALAGEEPIIPTSDLSDLRVVVVRVSTIELIDIQRRYGLRVDLRDIRQNNRHGFTIVKRNLTTGAFTCEIYLPNDRRPRTVDDEATLTIGHEFLHCLLGEYHQ
jgi:hypothetical protein